MPIHKIEGYWDLMYTGSFLYEIYSLLQIF